MRWCALVLVIGMCAAAEAAHMPVTRTVAIDGVAYEPADLTVHVGDSVVWNNKDPFPHTVTAKGGAFDSKQLDAGGKWTYRAQKKGDYPYICTLHPTMAGTLHVR